MRLELMAGAWLGFSLAAYALYWLDKRAARAGRRRVAERTLHLVGVCGGWPGALLAQRQFRHKTAKQPFQAIFWATVAINLVAAWLLRPDF